MIMLLLEAASTLLLAAGCMFTLVGAIGVLRLPDVYTRLHAAGVVDTLGAGLLLAGLVVHAGFSLAAGKLLLILVFLWLTTTAACHALAKAALRAGQRPAAAVEVLGADLDRNDGGGSDEGGGSGGSQGRRETRGTVAAGGAAEEDPSNR